MFIDIEKINDREEYKLGSITEFDGKKYMFVKVPASTSLVAGNLVAIDVNYNVSVVSSATSYVDGVVVADVSTGSGEVKYVWVCIDGMGVDVKVEKGISAGDLLVGGAVSGISMAVKFSAGSASVGEYYPRLMALEASSASVDGGLIRCKFVDTTFRITLSLN